MSMQARRAGRLFSADSTVSRLLIFTLLALAHLGLLRYRSSTHMTTDRQPAGKVSSFFWLLPASPEVHLPETVVARPLPSPQAPAEQAARSVAQDAGAEAEAPSVISLTEEQTGIAVSTSPGDTISVISASEPITIDRNVRQIYRDVEKELKQAFPNRIPPELVAAKGSFLEFQKQVAAAARNSDLTYRTYTTPDGTLVTKVTSSSGSYCVFAPNTAGGATIIEREGKGFRVTNC